MNEGQELRLRSISIERLTDEHEPELERFLRAQSHTTIFHTRQWHQVIQATYGHECDYWIALSHGNIVGVFPIVRVTFPCLGTKCIAMPYQYHSGIPRAESEDIQRQLVERAVAAARESGARYLEIRHCGASELLKQLGLQAVDSGLVTTTTSLQNFEFGQIRRNVRRNIVSAEKQGVTIALGESQADLRSFWSMYLEEGRALGAPLAGWKFFQHASRLLGQRCSLLMARASGKLLGSFWTIDDGRTCFARCGVYSSPEATRLHVGQALRWEAMQQASRRGCVAFDHGVSWAGDRGLIHHKEGWNGSTRTVYVYVYPLRSSAPEPGSYFEGYQLAKAVWRRLPLPVVDLVGRKVTRWVC